MKDNVHWYVAQTLSGHEQKVKLSIDKRCKLEEMEEFILDTMIPMKVLTEIKLGKKSTVKRKFFPGYILIQGKLCHDDHTINEKVWDFITKTPGVIGIIGGDNPSPLSEREIKEIFDQLDYDSQGPAKADIDFKHGEIVRIHDGGPFDNLEGKIDQIDYERGKIKLFVAIFGRLTPVEVGHWQVSRD